MCLAEGSSESTIPAVSLHTISPCVWWSFRQVLWDLLLWCHVQMKEARLLQRFVCCNNEIRHSVAHLLDGLRVWKIFSPFRTAVLHLFHSIALFCTLSSAHNGRGHLDSFYLPDGMFHNRILIFLCSVNLWCPWRSAQVWMLWNRKMCFNCINVGNWLFKPLLIIVQKLCWILIVLWSLLWTTFLLNQSATVY